MSEEIKLQLDVERDNYETLGKAANLLLVAHAGGIVACLTVLKEPAAQVIFKNVGFLLVLFGAGMLFAIWGYSLVAIARIYKIREMIGLERPSRIFLVAHYVMYPALFLSMLQFTAAIWELIYRYWRA